MTMKSEKKKKIIELALLVIGSIIVTFFISAVLGVSIYAVGVMIIILVVIIGTGIWRWKQGENVAPDFTINKEAEKIVVMTDDNIDRRYHVPLGTVYGEAIITVHMVTDLWAGAKTAIGGEPVQYQKMMTMTRKIAVNRMKMGAYEKGATLITGHRLATTQIVDRAAEVMAYGTAWKRIDDINPLGRECPWYLNENVCRIGNPNGINCCNKCIVE